MVSDVFNLHPYIKATLSIPAVDMGTLEVRR